MKLLILDGNSILNRVFYGIKILTNKNGVHTNAIYGFLVMLDKLKGETKSDAIAVAFDLPAKTFRHKAFSGYKAGRKGMPKELLSQLPILKELLEALGIKIVECEGFEADDILGTLALECEKRGKECVIATGDKDALQLVSEKVTVRISVTKCGRPNVIFYNLDQVRKEFELEPKQLIDVKALKGDTSDNIPGVIGIGKKNAEDLIMQFGSLENLYKNLDSLLIRDSIRKKLQEGKDSATMSYILGKIRVDAPIDKNLENYLQKEPDYSKVQKMMLDLELFSLLKKMKNQAIFFKKEENALLNYPKIIYEKDLKKVFNMLNEKKIANFVTNYINKKITSIAFVLKNEIWIVEENTSKFNNFLKEFLENSSIKKYTYNVKALFLFTERYNIKAQKINFDALLAAYILNPASKDYDLESLAFRYGDNFQFSKNFYDSLPKDNQTLVKEAIEFSKIYSNMIKKIKECSQNKLLKEIEIPTSRILSMMEIVGIAIDKEGILKYSADIDEKIQKIQKEIFCIVGFSFNIKSSKQLGNVLFKTLGLISKKRGSRDYSTDFEVLKKLRLSHPIIDKVIKFRTLTKIKSVYCDGLIKNFKKTGRTYTIFKQTETRTGRLSSAEPNLQNIPIKTSIGRELRKFFCAPNGRMLVNADYSQIELRVLAHVSEDKKMIEAFKLDQDIHVITASEVFDVPLDMVTKSMRQHAKIVNFGIVYGMSAFSLSKDIDMGIKEAGDYIVRYFERYSGIKKYFEETLKLGKKRGFVETIFGRRRYLPELTSSNYNLKTFGERAAMNMPIQGSAADIIKIAMIKIADRLKKELMDANIVLQVHDELIIEANEKHAENVAKILEEEMTSCVDLKVNLKAHASIGKTWYDTKLCRVM